ncbi:hypothetical protein [Saccharothrix deserti]|uniref:hypothetical protein n=1 Tax=Saccharothrix deserti TaxID=2593674 RepID=UPI00131EC1E5|nr:hypothetical protein [Saccharothrix deserti]
MHVVPAQALMPALRRGELAAEAGAHEEAEQVRVAAHAAIEAADAANAAVEAAVEAMLTAEEATTAVTVAVAACGRVPTPERGVRTA